MSLQGLLELDSVGPSEVSLCLVRRMRGAGRQSELSDREDSVEMRQSMTHLRFETLDLMPPSRGPKLDQLSGALGKASTYSFTKAGKSASVISTPVD